MTGSRRLGIVLAVGCLASVSLGAQLVTYDFNALTGSDVHPFTNLDGQGGWTSQGYIGATPTASLQMGVTATLGFDGTQALRFEDIGAGYGADASHLRDAALPLPDFTGGESLIVLQADIYVGFWEGSLGWAHDANGDGEIRRPVDASEIGPVVRIGSNDATAGLSLYAADGTFERVPLATAGAAGGEWIRVRLTIDPGAYGGAGSGTVATQNLTLGATELVPVSGLINLPLALDSGASDGANPALWDAVWIHFEGATYQLDNLTFGAVPGAHEIPTLSIAGLAALVVPLAAGGLLLLRRRSAA